MSVEGTSHARGAFRVPQAMSPAVSGAGALPEAAAQGIGAPR